MAEQPAIRPGGRTARVRASVHGAVLALLDETDWDDLSIPLVAERSGVHPATIYRRWGTLSALVDDVVSEELTRSAPVPDTGSLRADVEQYAVLVAENVAGPLGVVFLRAAALAMRPSRPISADHPHRPALPTRTEQIQGMLDRASERGEMPPSLQELFEIVMAPIYLQALFFNRPADPDHARMLVDRLFTFAEQRSDQPWSTAGSAARGVARDSG